MAIKFTEHISLADISANKRKCKHIFFDQVNKLIDWAPIQKLLKKYTIPKI